MTGNAIAVPRTVFDAGAVFFKVNGHGIPPVCEHFSHSGLSVNSLSWNDVKQEFVIRAVGASLSSLRQRTRLLHRSVYDRIHSIKHVRNFFAETFTAVAVIFHFLDNAIQKHLHVCCHIGNTERMIEKSFCPLADSFDDQLTRQVSRHDFRFKLTQPCKDCRRRILVQF